MLEYIIEDGYKMVTVKSLEETLERFENGTLETSKSKLTDLKFKQILLYGAGNIGKKLYKSLKDNGVKVECFIDRNKYLESSKYEVPVYHPESNELSEFKEKGYVILSALFSLNVCHEIKKQLYEIGFKNVYALHEVNISTVVIGAFYKNLFNDSYNKTDIIGKDRSKVIEAFTLLEDVQDKELFFEYLKAHLTMDVTRLKTPYDISLQYLAHDIPYEKNFSRFIDCGGFDGDTIRNFISRDIHIESIAIFEPQNDLHQKIVDYVHQNTEKLNSATIFPCGVYSKAEKMRFSASSDAKSSAKLDKMGNDIIQCVAIDDVLQGFNPTFIKMDIEGAEIEALKGARRTITEYYPQLAICVYHSLPHIWEIPLLIKSFYQGYRFFLRSYSSMGFETVLYAFPKK